MLGGRYGTQSSSLVVSKCKTSIPTLSPQILSKAAPNSGMALGQVSGELRLALPLPGWVTLDKSCNMQMPEFLHLQN